MKMESANREEEFTLKEKLLYTGGAIALTTGVFWLGRSIVRKLVSTSKEKKTMTEGAPETYAKQIKMAFDNDGWLGTDTTKLRLILREIPSKQLLKQVAASYQKLYHSSMYKDMSDELQSTEYNEMLSIVTAKPDRIEKKGEQTPGLTTIHYTEWAKRLKAAFDKTYGPFPGTDEDAIKAVFTEIPTQAVFMEVAKSYFKLYNRGLLSDLKEELEFFEFGDYIKIITSKPQK